MFLRTDVVCVESLFEPDFIESAEEENLVLVYRFGNYQLPLLSRT